MTFSSNFVADLCDRAAAVLPLEERFDDDDVAHRWPRADNPDLSGARLRYWNAPSHSRVDRMLHADLQADRATIHLFFLFGRAHSAMPHFHAQVIEFGPDQCVFNVDLLPRLDPIEHPDYYAAVFYPLNKPYWRAISDPGSACAGAPANPAIAALLSPWSIATGRPAPRSELDRVAPQIHAYLDHYLELADGLDYSGAGTDELAVRNDRHLDLFFSDHLDRRAWRGVYDLLGDEAGRELRLILQTGRSHTANGRETDGHNATTEPPQ